MAVLHLLIMYFIMFTVVHTKPQVLRVHKETRGIPYKKYIIAPKPATIVAFTYTEKKCDSKTGFLIAIEISVFFLK